MPKGNDYYFYVRDEKEFTQRDFFTRTFYIYPELTGFSDYPANSEALDLLFRGVLEQGFCSLYHIEHNRLIQQKGMFANNNYNLNYWLDSHKDSLQLSMLPATQGPTFTLSTSLTTEINKKHFPDQTQNKTFSNVTDLCAAMARAVHNQFFSIIFEDA